MGWRGTDKAFPVSGQRGWYVDGRGFGLRVWGGEVWI